MANSINYGLAGANSPLPHQIAIKELLCFFDRTIKRNNANFNVVSEMNVRFYTEKEFFDKNGDIVIWKPSKMQTEKITEPIIIVEITRIPFPKDINNNNNPDFIKIKSYFDKFPSLKEAFLYNYTSHDISQKIIRFSKKSKNSKLTKELGKFKVETLNSVIPHQLI